MTPSLDMNEVKGRYSGKEVLITGGLGMMGSSIAHQAVMWGARVVLMDSCLEPYGANVFNVRDIQDRLRIVQADIREKEATRSLIKGKDIVFNLAGQVSHNDSLENPFLDADINYFGHLNVLENLHRHNPKAIVIHAGSRLQFGRIETIPVNEKHPLNPRTPYALNKTAAENMYLFYNQIHGQACVLFRVANPYGPRSQMKHSKYSMVNWFIRQAMEGKTVSVFGGGEQIRDYVFVEDLAEAFLIAAVHSDCRGQVYNIGSGIGTSFKEMAETVVKEVGNGTVAYVPWPDHYLNVETGDYVTNIDKFHQATGWVPKVSLKEGIQRTHQYYQQFGSYYGMGA
jgi:UDP-glucose 4-epimerase